MCVCVYMMHMYVCAHEYRMDMHVRICGSLRLMSGIILNYFFTLFTEAGSFSLTQRSPIWLALLGTLLWGPPPHPDLYLQDLELGHRATPGKKVGW